MPRIHKRSFFVLIGAFLIAGSISFWLLLENNVICVSRTGAQPAQHLFADRSALYDFSLDMRQEVLAALIHQFDPVTGFFDYSINPDGTLSSSNNAIRQLLGSRILAEESEGDQDVLQLHEQNLKEIFAEWYREDGDIGYVYYDAKSKLGANAMLLRTLSVSPIFEDYREEAEKLANGIYALQREDGSFEPWYREPSYAYDTDYLLTFYSGEAILALLEYAERGGDVAAFEAAVQAQDHYLIEYVEQIEENYYPAYVPWHTQSLAHLFSKTGDMRYANALFILNDRLLELQDRVTYVGRFSRSDMPEYGSPHAASDAVYTEGLVHAFDVAQRVGDNARIEAYHDAIVYGIHNLSRLQFEPKRFSFIEDAEVGERIRGGIQTHACSNWVRIDTNAHTVDALTALLVRL